MTRAIRVNAVLPYGRQLACALLISAALGAQGAPAVRTVVRPVLNIYSAPTLDADVVSQAIYGTSVAILERKDSWFQIRTPVDDYTGWVESAGLVERGGEAYAAGGNVVQVRSLFAHIYRDGSVTRHAPLLTVPFETRLELHPEDVKTAERWRQVRLPDDRTGFIQSGDLAAAATPLHAEDTVAFARQFLGLPYTWGGTSSFGYDCSGFMQMLMRQRGRLLPRDSGVQARWSGFVAVQTSALRPGDALYFGESVDRITHTGMYIGDGQFISATAHERPMVRIDRLDDPYWAKLLVAARRIKP